MIVSDATVKKGTHEFVKLKQTWCIPGTTLATLTMCSDTLWTSTAWSRKILFFSISSNFYHVDEHVIGFWLWKKHLRLENPFCLFEREKPASHVCFVPRITFRLKCMLLFFTHIYFNDHIYMILQQVGLFIHMEKYVRSLSCSRS